MRRTKSFGKYLFCIFLLSTFTQHAVADHYSSSRKGNHYIALSLAGGEASNLSYNSSVANLLGAGANFRLAYEWQKNKWMLGFGVQADYQYLRDSLANFTDAFARQDRVGTDVLYRYNYLSYKETDDVLMVSVPVYFGRRFADFMYFTLGASFMLPLRTRMSVSTQLYTDGVYDFGVGSANSIGSEDFSTYGYYPLDTYKAQQSYTEAMRVSADVELGAYIPLGRQKNDVMLRAGIYGRYGVRLGTYSKTSVADYSEVNADPQSLSQADLQQHLSFHSIQTSAEKWGHNIEVGVRLTLLIDVTAEKHHCMCNDN